jgi:hypothetical protein
VLSLPHTAFDVLLLSQHLALLQSAVRINNRCDGVCRRESSYFTLFQGSVKNFSRLPDGFADMHVCYNVHKSFSPFVTDFESESNYSGHQSACLWGELARAATFFMGSGNHGGLLAGCPETI